MAVEVIAIELGFWDNTRRRPGDRFLVPEEFADKAKWWYRADGPPPAEVTGDRGPTPPGNANAQHVPGSPADQRRKGPRSSAARVVDQLLDNPAVAEGEDGAAAQDQPKGKGKGGKPAGAGDQKVI